LIFHADWGVRNFEVGKKIYTLVGFLEILLGFRLRRNWLISGIQGGFLVVARQTGRPGAKDPSIVAKSSHSQTASGPAILPCASDPILVIGALVPDAVAST
jgi:hypothetical protein